VRHIAADARFSRRSISLSPGKRLRAPANCTADSARPSRGESRTNSLDNTSHAGTPGDVTIAAAYSNPNPDPNPGCFSPGGGALFGHQWQQYNEVKVPTDIIHMS